MRNHELNYLFGTPEEESSLDIPEPSGVSDHQRALNDYILSSENNRAVFFTLLLNVLLEQQHHYQHREEQYRPAFVSLQLSMTYLCYFYEQLRCLCTPIRNLHGDLSTKQWIAAYPSSSEDVLEHHHQAMYESLAQVTPLLPSISSLTIVLQSPRTRFSSISSPAREICPTLVRLCLRGGTSNRRSTEEEHHHLELVEFPDVPQLLIQHLELSHCCASFLTSVLECDRTLAHLKTFSCTNGPFQSWLDSYNNSLSNLLKALPSITRLDWSHQQLVSIKLPFYRCSELRTLNVGFNHISSLVNLSGCMGNISRLILTKNWIRSIRGLEKLVGLQYVDLSHNHIQEFHELTILNELPKLTHLILRENPIAYVPHYREHVLFHLCNGTLETAVVVLDAREWTKSEWHAIRSRSCSTLVAQREWRQNRVCLSKNVVQFSSSDSVELTRVAHIVELDPPTRTGGLLLRKKLQKSTPRLFEFTFTLPNEPMCTRMENSLLNPGATADGIQVDRLAVPTWILGSERDETPAGESFDTEQRGIPQQIRFQDHHLIEEACTSGNERTIRNLESLSHLAVLTHGHLCMIHLTFFQFNDGQKWNYSAIAYRMKNLIALSNLFDHLQHRFMIYHCDSLSSTILVFNCIACQALFQTKSFCPKMSREHPFDLRASEADDSASRIRVYQCPVCGAKNIRQLDDPALVRTQYERMGITTTFWHELLRSDKNTSSIHVEEETTGHPSALFRLLSCSSTTSDRSSILIDFNDEEFN